jgi:hypothetical protein
MSQEWACRTTFDPVAMRLVTLDVPGGSGEAPAVRFGNAHLKRLQVLYQNPKHAPRETESALRLELEGRPMTPGYARELVRSLYKQTCLVSYTSNLAAATQCRLASMRLGG